MRSLTGVVDREIDEVKPNYIINAAGKVREAVFVERERASELTLDADGPSQH